MSLAHLQMTYAAAAGSAANQRLLFNQFNPSHYHNTQSYYPTCPTQNVSQSGGQYQRSNFAIQEILGLNSQTNHTSQSFNPFFLNMPTLSPTETHVSNNSSQNSLESNDTRSTHTAEMIDEKNFLNRANEAAAYAAAYGAYFSRTNFMSNFPQLDPGTSKAQIQTTSESVNSEDENLNDTFGKIQVPCLF